MIKEYAIWKSKIKLLTIAGPNVLKVFVLKKDLLYFFIWILMLNTTSLKIAFSAESTKPSNFSQV